MEKTVDKHQVKRAKITTGILVTSIVFALVSLTYAFTRSRQVERISKEAEQVKVLAEKHRLEAEQVAAEASMRLSTHLKLWKSVKQTLNRYLWRALKICLMKIKNQKFLPS